MSTFQVAITPPKSCSSASSQLNEARKPIVAVLAPFTPKVVVPFDSIPVTKTARRFLLIRNPSEADIQIYVTKIVSPEYNVRFEWMQNQIPAASELSMEIEWTPLRPYSKIESMQLTDNRGFKKDIQIVLKSIAPKAKNARRSPPRIQMKVSKRISPPKKIQTKNSPTASGRRRSYSSSVLQTRKVQFSSNASTQQHQQVDTRKIVTSYEFEYAMEYNKENTTTENASVLFDQFQFTPATETKSKSTLDYLVSLPTPIATGKHVLQPSNGAAPATSPIKRIDPKNLFGNCITPNITVEPFIPEVVSTAVKPNAEFSKTLNTSFAVAHNKTYEVGEAELEAKLSFENISSDNLTSSPIQITETHITNDPFEIVEAQPSRLSMISEEVGQRKRNDDDDLLYALRPEIVIYPTTPMRKMASYQNLNIQKQNTFNQGSMPNLSSDLILAPIEKNRYFKGSPDTMEMRRNLTSNFAFYDNEVRTQSSCLNLNEIEHSINFEVLETPRREERAVTTTAHNIIKYDKAVAMTVTPPRRECYGSQNLENRDRGRVIRVNSWNGVQQQKTVKPIEQLVLKKKVASNSVLGASTYSSTTSSKSSPRKFRLDGSEQRGGQLYNYEHHLQAIINPDPFAATTTHDPFLSCTMYLDKTAVDRHEEHFKKWLNALVTVPEEYDVNQKIDLGNLFQEVKKRSIAPAPTREIVSSKYFTAYRMNSLRKIALELFQSPEMTVPLSKVVTLVQKKQIEIRTDRSLHLDVVLQRNILELLLSFNPLWLRIGLEIVFNEKIPLYSNFDVKGLAQFMLARLFGHKYFENKPQRTFSKDYEEQVKVSALKHILILLFFLDKAKEKRIIRHNPCLFTKNSKYKDTREILIQFSSSVVANIGDITKYLKRLGYVLTHKQTFLDEFDYAFNNLAVDLRDGVRLTRVMEVILMREDMTQCLRAPAISRLQKIHNVDVALQALAQANFVILGDISAKDIVDGHREKTLSLLWQIIYKFRAPKFNAAATTIQTWWRQSYLKVVINRRVKRKTEIRRCNAATLIQSAFRSYLCRRYVQVYANERRQAVVILQKHCRRYQAMRRYEIMRQSVVKIQRWYRKKLEARNNQTRIEFVVLRKTVTTVQKIWRRRLLVRQIRTQYLTLRTTVIHIQKKFRANQLMKVERQRYIELRAAKNIQNFYRRYRLTKIQRSEYLQLRQSTIVIQQRYRALKQMQTARNEFLQTKNAALVLQQRYRAQHLMQVQRREYEQLRKATVVIQRQFMAQMLYKRERTHYLLMRKSVLTIQVRLRAYLEMKVCRSQFLQQRNSAVSIQRQWRALSMMKTQRRDYLLLKQSITFIQMQFRANQLMKVERQRYVAMRVAAMKIQSFYRMHRLTQTQRSEYLQLRQATIVIQQRYRAQHLMQVQRREYQQLRKAMVVIQRRFIAQMLYKNARTHYLLVRKSVLTIQIRLRAYLEMKVCRSRFLQQKSATLTIQRQWRAWSLMKTQRRDYMLLKHSVTFIQMQFRANQLMKVERQRYVAMRVAAINIQSFYRMHRLTQTQRSEYLQLRQATIVIQQRYRAQHLMQVQRREYQQLRKATVTIQRRFIAHILYKRERTQYLLVRKSVLTIQIRLRAYLEMKVCRSRFLQQKSAALTIQRQCRAWSLMKTQRRDYMLLKHSVTFIQMMFRENRKMKAERQYYQTLRTTTITIQQIYRRKLLFRSDRHHFLTYRNSAIAIQRKFRGYLQMKKERNEYLQQRSAAIQIQSYYRRYRAQKMYLQIKRATSLIQCQYRAMLQMRVERKDFQILRHTCIKVQRKYREKIMMQKTRSEYLQYRNAAIKIQSFYRMYRVHAHYRRLRNAIIVFQRAYRAQKQMMHTRQEYHQLRHFTIIIQCRFRARIEMRLIRTQYLTIRTAAITIQRRYRASREMKIVRAQYLLIRSLVICIQRKFRAHILMKTKRVQYLALTKAAICIQRAYRARLEMQRVRHNYGKLKSSMVPFQAASRGYVSRVNYQQLRLEKLTPEALQLRKQQKAVRKIQAFVRGYIVRKNSTRAIREIRNRVKRIDTSDRTKSVRHNFECTIDLIRGRHRLGDYLSLLERLNNLTRHVPYIFAENDYSDVVANFCYQNMSRSIRSESDKCIIDLCSKIILNLARYAPTTDHAFKPKFFVTITQMLKRWSDKDCDTFNTLCTLMWVFAHNNSKRRKIQREMITGDSKFMLREIRKLVLRKEKMKKNQRRNIDKCPVSNVRQLPHFEPDFGVVKGKPYMFLCSMYAFEIVLDKLEVEI